MKGLERKLEHYSMEDTMNIKLTRDQRVILWNLLGNEKDRIVAEIDKPYIDDYLTRRLKELKILEILIIG